MKAGDASELRDLLRQHDAVLTESDRRLAEILLSSPAEGTYLSINEVARKAGVHPTTASRFARKLGFGSYPELRLRLRVPYVADSSAMRIKKRIDRIAAASVARSVIGSEVRALQDLPQYISQAHIDAVVDALIAAGRILVFGRGHSTALVDLMTRRLSRSGYLAEGFGHLDWEAPEHLARLKPNDVLLVFSFRGIREEVETLLTFARELGAKTVLISDFIGSAVRQKPNFVLSAPRGEEGEYQSLIVPMAICNILILELSRRDGGRSIRSLQHLVQVKSRLARPRRQNGT